MKYKAGDRVKAKSLDWYNENKNKFGKVYTSGKGGQIPFEKHMSKWCGKVMTISDVRADHYTMIEDLIGYWTDEMIECKVEEETKTKPKFKVGDKIKHKCDKNNTIITITCLKDNYYYIQYYNNNKNVYQNEAILFTDQDKYETIEGLIEDETLIERIDDNGLPFNEWLSYKGAFHIPYGYELKDENGNVINAQKIVLEKKKPKYPKTYIECYEVIYGKKSPFHMPQIIKNIGYKGDLFTNLQRLIFCRDAYWKIAGEEMGLDKPWEYDDNKVFGIIRQYNKIQKYNDFVGGSTILEFPTKEMRDVFYETFKELIEECKELL